MSDFGGGEAAPSAMMCGRPVAATAVGLPVAPGQPAPTCRNQIFELIEQARADGLPRDPVTRKTLFKTHCVACHAEDPMDLIATPPPQEGPWPHAAQIPALLQQRAHPGMLVCPSCSAYRFVLQDDGNEIKARCVQCKGARHFGFEGQSTDRRAPRSFADELKRTQAQAQAASGAASPPA